MNCTPPPHCTHAPISPVCITHPKPETDQDGVNPPGNGTTFAIRPDKELDIVAENTLGERVFASSTINQSSIHFKGAQHLYAIGK